MWKGKRKLSEAGACCLGIIYLADGGEVEEGEGGHTTPQTALPAHKRGFEKWLNKKGQNLLLKNGPEGEVAEERGSHDTADCFACTYGAGGQRDHPRE